MYARACTIPIVFPFGVPFGDSQLDSFLKSPHGIPIRLPYAIPIGSPCAIPIGVPSGFPFGFPIGIPIGFPNGIPITLLYAVAIGFP